MGDSGEIERNETEEKANDSKSVKTEVVIKVKDEKEVPTSTKKTDESEKNESIEKEDSNETSDSPPKIEDDKIVKSEDGKEPKLEDPSDSSRIPITETSLSSQTLKSANPSITSKNESQPAVSSDSLKSEKKAISRNQSNILPSLREISKDEEDPSLMIFSHKGLPTRKYFRRREINPIIASNVEDIPPLKEPIVTHSSRIKQCQELTPKISQRVPRLTIENDKTPTTPKSGNINNPSISRNVLTGRGMNSHDEFKYRTTRRKDGNPLLGLGYDEPVVANTRGRVPPGGFSDGLW